ncbi:MAG: DUF1549 domain-containing protein [Verrucomicrobiaceae bacterium]|nr:DUF1549 domain-containing protein [Verrucomicrobiaceae bacterium]
MTIRILAVAALLTTSAHAAAIRASNDPVKDERPITAADRDHWAWKKLAASDKPHRLDALTHPGAPVRDEALIRRITFDLIGLPPTPEEISTFKAERTREPEAAIHGLIQRLLSSPRYGEHWAQWWLDLARYAETDGFEHDKDRPHAWKYRDWVIAALNRDMPLDEFVRMQIAGDLLGDETATGFLFAGPDMPDINNQDLRRHTVLNDITATVGTVCLGLTIGCAQCHDHPYDPLSQADFYRLRAFFDDTVLTQRDKQLGPSVRPFAKGVPASVVFVRGDHTRPGPRIQPGLPRLMNGAAQDRAALAQALTSSENALFLRTMANRLWQQHFGTPLSANPGDLGHQGTAPENPALLDWLAAEIPRQNWSLKKLHTLILLSRTYQQASLPPRRLTGEMLRDTLLSISGDLNLHTGGESVHLPLPAAISSTLLKKHAEKPSEPAQLNRRSIYTFARRNARHPVLDLFDRPDALAPCSRRNESTTAPQALLMLNSDLSVQTAQKLAAGLKADFGSEMPQIVHAAILRCFGREPRKADFDAATGFFAKQADFSLALEDYCLALLNANEFIFVD